MGIPDLIGLKAKLITAGAVLALIGVIVLTEEVRISGLQDDIVTKDAQITKLTGDVAVADANVAVLTATVKRQNGAIGALKAQKATLDAEVREKALSAQKKRQESVSVTEGAGVDSMNQFFQQVFK